MNAPLKLTRGVRRFAVASIALAMMAWSSVASASMISNGDFEATPFDTGWNNTAATLTTGLYGSTQAAEFGANANGRLSQTFDAKRDFIVEFAFSPTNVAGSRTLNAVLYNAPNTGMGDAGASLNMRSDASGDFQVFNGAWVTIPGGAGAFSVGNEYGIRLVGNDIGDGGANTYDLFWTDANGTSFDNSALGLSDFQNTPSSPDGYSALAFIKLASNGGYVVDNVSVSIPEPGTLVLVALALGIAVVTRRK